ncbi:unnamed protein product, partial [Symbiodinium pilosum]
FCTKCSMVRGQEEEGFLQTLKWSIEARVPGVHGPPAGTGGTGNAGEEDSDSQDGNANGKEGLYASGATETASMRSFETGLSDQERIYESPRRQCRIISPRSPWKVCWDLFVGVLIIYTIIAMTWRIGFDQAAQGGALVFDYAVDVVFAVDTILCFRTGFYAESAEETLITDPWEIAKRYCMSYFLFDLLSWLPLDLLVQVITGQSSAEMKSVKLMKFVRLIRLAKLMRLFKLGRFLAILEEQLHLKPAMIRMVRLILNIVFLAHLLACMWHFIALPGCGESEDISSIGPCSDRLDDVYSRPNWIRVYNVDEFGLVSKYIASFHFITATMMAVGYGDIWAKNTDERLFCIVLQLFGATAFGFILSSVTSLLESANPRANETNKRLNEIKEWCTGRRMPRHLRVAIREHTQYVLHKKSIFNEADILGNMPMSIRMDIIQNSYSEWLRTLERPFHEEDLAFRIELVQLMMPQHVLQNEVVIEDGEITAEVYVVNHGCLEAICDGDRADLAQLKTWVQQCLKRSPLGNVLEEEHEDDSVIQPSVACEVLCGIYQSADLVGQIAALPVMVRGFSSRTDVLVINKDALADVQLRFPGATARAETNEEKLKQEMVKVLASELRSGLDDEREAKSLVLIHGVASSAEDLPPVVLNTDRATPIPAALLRVPSGETRDDTNSEPSPRKVRSLADPTSSPSSPSPRGAKTLASLSSAGTKASRSSHQVLLSTRRIDPATGLIESVEETEDHFENGKVEASLGLEARVNPGPSGPTYQRPREAEQLPKMADYESIKEWVEGFDETGKPLERITKSDHLQDFQDLQRKMKKEEVELSKLLQKDILFVWEELEMLELQNKLKDCNDEFSQEKQQLEELRSQQRVTLDTVTRETIDRFLRRRPKNEDEQMMVDVHFLTGTETTGFNLHINGEGAGSRDAKFLIRLNEKVESLGRQAAKYWGLDPDKVFFLDGDGRIVLDNMDLVDIILPPVPASQSTTNLKSSASSSSVAVADDTQGKEGEASRERDFWMVKGRNYCLTLVRASTVLSKEDLNRPKGEKWEDFTFNERQLEKELENARKKRGGDDSEAAKVNMDVIPSLNDLMQQGQEKKRKKRADARCRLLEFSVFLLCQLLFLLSMIQPEIMNPSLLLASDNVERIFSNFTVSDRSSAFVAASPTFYDIVTAEQYWQWLTGPVQRTLLDGSSLASSMQIDILRVLTTRFVAKEVTGGSSPLNPSYTWCETATAATNASDDSNTTTPDSTT